MEKHGTWSVDNYHQLRRLLLDEEDAGRIRPEVMARCEDGGPVGREEWEGSLARLNTYERFVLLPLLETDLLTESADYCAKHSDAGVAYRIPLTYNESMATEYLPLLIDRLRSTTALADGLAQTCLELSKPKPEIKSSLPFKATRVRVADNRRVNEVTEILEDWESWALELGCREPFWYSDFEFEVMATSPQQHNLAHYAYREAHSANHLMLHQPLLYPLITDEGKIDPEEIIISGAVSWRRPVVEKLAMDIGCREVTYLASGVIFCLATAEQRAKLITLLHSSDHHFATVSSRHKAPGVGLRVGMADPNLTA
ncbi:hypothetical protein LCGC14_2563450 [marine sediment metagenome]|uniref:Uncharacterized protein n=1 Tax=marine sediment metagenome TaxID=412755 RepID=A0A0F9AJV8_9ZZZZ